MPNSSGKDIVLMIDGTRQGPEDPQSSPTNVEGLAYYLDAPSIRRADKLARPVDVGAGLRHPAWTDPSGYLSGIGAETMHVPRFLPAASGAGMAHMIRLAYKFLSSTLRAGGPNLPLRLFTRSVRRKILSGLC